MLFQAVKLIRMRCMRCSNDDNYLTGGEENLIRLDGPREEGGKKTWSFTAWNRQFEATLDPADGSYSLSSSQSPSIPFTHSPRFYDL